MGVERQARECDLAFKKRKKKERRREREGEEKSRDEEKTKNRLTTMQASCVTKENGMLEIKLLPIFFHLISSPFRFRSKSYVIVCGKYSGNVSMLIICSLCMIRCY